MLNEILGLSGLELKMKEEECTEIDFPDIRFETDEGTVTEAIIEYGKNVDGRFYVITGGNKIIYIDDEATQEMIHYGDSSHIVNSGGKLEKEVDLVVENEKVVNL